MRTSFGWSLSAALAASWSAFGCGSGEGDATRDGDAGVTWPDADDARGDVVDAQRDRGSDAPAPSSDGSVDVRGDGLAARDAPLPLDEGTDGGESRNDASDAAREPASDAARAHDARETDGDGSVDADASSSGDASPRGDGGVCGALTTGPIPVAGDVAYTYAGAPQPACLSAPFCQVGCDGALLSGLLACEAVQGGYYWGQGSAYIRVLGRQAGACVFEIAVETEGAVTSQRCTTRLPVQPWRGLFYGYDGGSSAAPDISNGLDDCQRAAPCNLLVGAPNQCDRGPAGPPLCPTNGVRGPC